jgi:hypothetical protein
MSFEQFVVDVLDLAGTIQGNGPLYNVVSIEIEEILDQAGSVSVTVPAHDERAIELLSATGVKIRPRVAGGTLRTGIVNALEIVPGPGPMFKASGPDLIGELTYLNCGYDRLYDDKDVRTEIIGATGTAASLLESTGWTQGSVEDYGNTTIKYDAETRLRALIMLGEQLGRHIRQGSTEQTLDFGLFGVDSGYRVINVDGWRQGMEDVANASFLGQIPTIQSISADVFNRIFPLGKDRFDMRYATVASTGIKVQANGGPIGVTTTVAVAGITAGDTDFRPATTTGMEEGQELWLGDVTDWTQDHEIVTIESIASPLVNIIGSFDNNYAIGTDVIQAPQFYVEDVASQGTYGVRESAPQFGWIAPVSLTGNLAIQERAADALYAAANDGYLTRYKDEYKNYALPLVLNLPDDLQVGQKIRLTYRGAVGILGGTLFADIDDLFYVMKISRRWESNGRKTASLEITNVSRPTPNNTALVLFNLDTNRWVGLS